MVTIFMTPERKKEWLCKSDINSFTLQKMGLGLYSIKKAQELFDELWVDDEYVRYFLTGDLKDKKRQRHTKFVKKFYFYRVLVKGNRR